MGSHAVTGSHIGCQIIGVFAGEAGLLGACSGYSDTLLVITKGSALEIPQNPEDVWSHVLSFQGQSPWL
jgi:hypothetical protein